MREIVLDTETTGLDPFDGHRVVEIGCVELINCIPTGRVWHCHLNPERDMPYQAFEVHGLSAEFLRDKPRFAELADDMLAFLEGAHARDAQRHLRFRLSQCRARSRRRGRFCAGTTSSTRWRWRDAGIPAPRAASMPCASATASICRSARSTARCSIAGFSPRVYVELVGGHQARLEFAVNGGQAIMLGTNAGTVAAAATAARAAADGGGNRGAPRFRGDLGAEALWLRY